MYNGNILLIIAYFDEYNNLIFIVTQFYTLVARSSAFAWSLPLREDDFRILSQVF